MRGDGWVHDHQASDDSHVSGTDGRTTASYSSFRHFHQRLCTGWGGRGSERYVTSTLPCLIVLTRDKKALPIEMFFSRSWARMYSVVTAATSP